MSKKFLPVMLVFTAASLFIAFKTQGRSDIDGNDNPKTKYGKVLRNVGLLLEEGHFSPRKINDDFSKLVLKKFEDDIDGDKSIFLQSDIDAFKKYETKIDDEIHGTEIESFFTINDVYIKRLNEASEYYTNILSKPFDFTINESVQLDGDKLGYPKTEEDRKNYWTKRLKYMVLDRYVAAQDDREKNQSKKDFVSKADSTLEREARDQVRKQIGRYFNTRKSRENKDEIFSVFVNAITGSMDPHTDYFPPVDLRSFTETMSGRFYGIGAQLKEDDGKIKIASLVSGGPAWKDGELKENDEILKIAQGKGEPVDVTGYATTDAVKLIRGAEKGSEVRLTVKKTDGSIKVIALTRDEIKLDDTFAKSAIINGKHKVGYIYLPEFYNDFEHPNGAKSAADIAKEVEKLKAENVEGIVLDLRDNGGGSLPDVVQIAGLFIEDGPIVQVKSRDEKPYTWKDKDKSVLYSGPLTVMVNENSASASEIFAAAIQDYKRGIVIGSSSTYGKGTVQRNISLNPDADNPLFGNKKTEDLGAVKLTLQKFYRINGDATQLKGVTPDIVIPDRLEFLKFREKDNPAALPWDEIEKADYKTWTAPYNAGAIVKEASDQIRNNNTFHLISSDVQWLQNESEKEVSLNIDKYRASQKLFKATYKQLDNLYRLAQDLDVKNTEADVVKNSTDKDKEEKNKQWLKRLGDDIYIDEAVKVMNTMIGDGGVVKKD
ncbi:MAG: carboxy terminal-processing peptidase [Ferruginibacter sp.]